MMKKLFLISLVLLSVSACANRYKITYDEKLVFDCPKTAEAGETVRFETVMVTDADLYVYLNGVELEPVKEGYYEFVMPEADVMIEVSIVSNGLA